MRICHGMRTQLVCGTILLLSVLLTVRCQELCDLARSCGGGTEACGASQSTYYDFADIKETNLLDSDSSTCAKTADAKLDPNPQWVRVDLGSEQRLIGTVRFWASGAASDYSVMITASDATVPDAADAPLAQGENPSIGATIPSNPELCAVNATDVDGVFEAYCPGATKGSYVFIASSASKQVVEVCNVEVYQHQCVADESPSCPFGFEPSSCESCHGCVPCSSGFYSDLVGPYQCTPCPGDPRPYSPPGSTSMFQCEGDAVLDSTSTLEVEEVAFNTAQDAWLVDIAFSQGPRVQVNGLSTLYMSNGGAAYKSGTYTASEFPCRAVDTETPGADLSASLSETVCCLQDLRDDYVTTKIFRDWSDGLDLIAANDICDAEDGSDVLVNTDLEVVGEGTEFVTVQGASFANKITVVPRTPPAATRRSYYEGMQYARITIPDAELYKISKTLNPSDDLTDSRELFIGLLDMLPTGTRVVDSANQQVKVVLTRTQYGSFAAYGAQNIDYDFISYLNARVYQVKNKDALNAQQLEYLDLVWYDTVQTEKCSIAEGVKGVDGPCERILTGGASWSSVCFCETETQFPNLPTTCPDPPNTCQCGCRSKPVRYPGWETNYAGPEGREAFLDDRATAYYAEISFVWDDRLEPAVEGSPVDVDTVVVNIQGDSIMGTYWQQFESLELPTGVDSYAVPTCRLTGIAEALWRANTVFLPLVNQACSSSLFPSDTLEDYSYACTSSSGSSILGQTCFKPVEAPAFTDPTDPFVEEGFCPQVVIADDNFGRLYVPFVYSPHATSDTGNIDISFNLHLKDADGKDASLKVDVVLAAEDFVTLCDEDAASVDLAERVIPAITIGTETANPPRLTAFGEDAGDFDTGAETLQDGLITLELALDETDGLDDNLEVFMEDVLVVQVNPGSNPTADVLELPPFVPSYTYDPDTRDATLHIPDELKAACSNTSFSESFFGCVYKHALAEEAVTNPEWAYQVGDEGASAQDFMAAMLGSGTAEVAARELGRDYEAWQLANGFATRKKIGLWINPGHVWGQTVHNSKYSLSQNVVIYVLYGVRSGVDGSERRMLLQASGDGRTLVQTPAIKFGVTAADVVANLLDGVVAMELQASLPLSLAEACRPQPELLALCAEKLQAAVGPHATELDSVHCLSVAVAGADCSGSRRADAAPTAAVAAVVALKDVPGAHLDVSAVVASGLVLSMETSTPTLVRPSTPDAPDAPLSPTATPASPEEEGSGSSSNTVVIAAAAAAGAVVVLALIAWKARGSCGSPQPLEEVVSTGVVGGQPQGQFGDLAHKDAMESILFNDGKPGL